VLQKICKRIWQKVASKKNETSRGDLKISVRSSNCWW